MSDGSSAEQERPDVTVVVVVFGSEPLLGSCIDSIVRSEGVVPEIVIVENGGSEDSIAALEARHALTVVRPGRNTGFAEGCNLGVAAGTAPFVALINPDAVVEPMALSTLVRAADAPDGRVVTAAIRLADRPEVINSAGTEVTFLGLSWAARFGEIATSDDQARAVAGANGGALACRRSTWDALSGLCPDMFVYYEDADFSVRAWLRGIPVMYIPEAVTLHDYDFSKNSDKFYFLERNRLITVLTCFELRHILITLPMQLALELGLLVLALREGWFGEKIRAYRWLLAHVRWVRNRREQVQQSRTDDLRPFYDVLTTGLFPGNLPSAHPPALVGRVADRYWRIARRLIRR